MEEAPAMTRRFTLSTDPLGVGATAWMHVTVHDTVAELQRAAQRYRPDPDPDFWEGCNGCFQPHDRPGYLGIMRLTYEDLSPDIVIHESVHAAVAYSIKSMGLTQLRLDHRSQTIVARREEVLAYALQEISCAVLRHLDLLPPTKASTP